MSWSTVISIDVVLSIGQPKNTYVICILFKDKAKDRPGPRNSTDCQGVSRLIERYAFESVRKDTVLAAGCGPYDRDQPGITLSVDGNIPLH
jgi:hypothetical protein